MRTARPSVRSVASSSIVALALLAVAGGCRSKPAQTFDAGGLQLGKSLVSSYAPILGEPSSRTSSNDEVGTREVRTFEPRGTVKLVNSAAPELRIAIMESLNDRLEAFVLLGPLREDRTPITPMLVNDEIVIGQTMETDLVRRLGEPIGRALPGTRLFESKQDASSRVVERLIWADYADGRRGLWRHELNLKLLLVDLDASRRVVNNSTIEWKQMMLGPRLR